MAGADDGLCSQTFLRWFSLLNLRLCSQSFLPMSSGTEQSLLFAAPASEANLRNETITFSAPCVCWIIEVKGAFFIFFCLVNYVRECERCSNSQLWKLCFRWVYVVIISSSHVTGCKCVYVCVCVSALEHACEQGCACVYMTADQERKWRRRQRRGERGKHYTAAEGERKGKGQENHRQIKEYDRNKESNERSLTAGSSPRLCCWIHRKHTQTCSKNESVSVWAGRVRIWLWNVFTLRSL